MRREGCGRVIREMPGWFVWEKRTLDEKTERKLNFDKERRAYFFTLYYILVLYLIVLLKKERFMIVDQVSNKIEVLFEKPEPTIKASLFIEPLAALSLVTSMPGAYYRSQREPSEFMIYGMLENLLGWHFTDNERDPIIRALKKYYKKAYKTDKDLVNIDFNKTGVGFKPLLQHHLKIEKLLLKPHVESFDDYWTQHLKDVDQRHAKGTRNYDHRIENEANDIYAMNKEKRDNAWKELFEKKTGLFPSYYQAPTMREFIIVSGKFGYPILANESVLNLLINAVNNLESPLYLGTNEGWIDLKIEKL
jgi:CRISPR-associated protein Cas5